MRQLILTICALLFTSTLAMADTELSITVQTGTVHKSGTGAKVFIKIYGTEGITKDIRLDNQENNFENGKTDQFLVNIEDIGESLTRNYGRDFRDLRTRFG